MDDLFNEYEYLQRQLDSLDSNDYHPGARGQIAEINARMNQLQQQIDARQAANNEAYQRRTIRPAGAPYVKGHALENFRIPTVSPEDALQIPNNQFDSPAVDLQNVQDPRSMHQMAQPFDERAAYGRKPVQMKLRFGGTIPTGIGRAAMKAFPFAALAAGAAVDPAEAAASMIPGWPGTDTISGDQDLPPSMTTGLEWDSKGQLQRRY